MHGSYAANMALTECDLLIALGVRFDDRVTGRLAAFAPHAKVIHVDIDPAEIGKNRAPDVPIVGDVKRVLAQAQQAAGRELEPPDEKRSKPRAAPGGGRSAHWKDEHPFDAPHVRYRNQAAAPDGRNRPALRRPGHRHLRRGPAPDVGGAAHPLQRAAPVDQLRRPGLHGLRPARRPSARRFARPDKLVFAHRAATAASRCPSRSWPPSPATACPSRSS